MRLATRCPSCTTMFLVVEDQLRVSDGWVRCGRCGNVFNAAEDLLDVDQGVPVRLDLSQPRPATPASLRLHTNTQDPRQPARPPSATAAPRPDHGQDTAEDGQGPDPRRGPHRHDDRGPQDLPPDSILAEPEDDGPRPASRHTARPGNPDDLDDLDDLDLPDRPDHPAHPDHPDHRARPAPQTPAAGPHGRVEPRLDDDGAWPATDLAAPAASAFEATVQQTPPPRRRLGSRPDDDDSAWPDHLLRAPSEPFTDPPEPEPEPDAPRRRADRGPRHSAWPPEPAPAAAATARRRAGAGASTDDDGDLLHEAPPSFVREADRAARWRQGPLRLLLVSAAPLLALLLALQAALYWRDLLAAHVPGLAPVAEALCRVAGCEVQPLRRIAQLSVEGSALNRLEDTPGPDGLRHRLSVQLRNRADTALMAPAMELTLTDARGEVVARRVLRMADFGSSALTLPAQQEVPLRLVLAAGNLRFDGYTVELFYP